MTRVFDPSNIPHQPELKFDWTQTKGRPVVLEIGCGTGDHPLDYARSHPDHFVIALERTNNKSRVFLDRLQGPDAPGNLFGQQADAIHWCAHNLPGPQPLERVFILYPNPYPKEKQANLRFANMPFMGFLLKHLKTGGHLEMATNIEEHALEANEKFVQQWGLKLVSDERISPSQGGRTAFEAKYLARGEKCYSLIFMKP